MTARNFFRKLRAVTPPKPKSNVYRKNGVLYHAGFGLPLFYVKKNEKKAKKTVAKAKKKAPRVGKTAVLGQELRVAKAELVRTKKAMVKAEAKAAMVRMPVARVRPNSDPVAAGEKFVQDGLALYGKLPPAQPAKKPKTVKQMRTTPRLVDPPRK